MSSIKDISGGGAREWLQPQDAEGNLRPEDGHLDIRGCHKGFYTGLNVVNPQPGMEYQWALNNPNQLMMARQRGWRQVQSDDPELSAYRAAVYGEDDSDQPTSLDSTDVVNELVLMRIPADKLSIIRDDQEKTRKAMLRGGSHNAFVRGARADEIETGHGRPTRFVAPQHSVTVEEGGRPVDQWTPDRQGISEE